MYEEVYTKVTVEVKNPRGETRSVAVRLNVWDLSAEDVAWMMRDAACALGFTEESVVAGFRLAAGCVDACPKIQESGGV